MLIFITNLVDIRNPVVYYNSGWYKWNVVVWVHLYWNIHHRIELPSDDVQLYIADWTWQFFFPKPEVFLSISRCTQSLVFSRWTPLPCIEVSTMEQRSISTPNQRILGGPLCLQLLWAERTASSPATFPTHALERTIHCDANYGDVRIGKKNNKRMPLSDWHWGFTLMLSLLSLFFSKVTTSSRMMWSKVNYLLLVYVLVAVLDSFLLWMVSYSIWMFVSL